MRLLNRAGVLAVVVTNQAGVARGYFPESLIAEVHARMNASMEAGGARLDGVYYCPHHPSAGEPPYRQDCSCRKPRPGLVRRAAEELGIDLARSWVVGDRHADVELARGVGARACLVKTGYGQGELLWHAPSWPRPPDVVTENLLEAVERILAEAEGAGSRACRGRLRRPPIACARSSNPFAAGVSSCSPTSSPTSSSTGARSA